MGEVLLPVKQFEAGKLYCFRPSKNQGKRPVTWNDRGLMDYMLDGKPHRCIKGDGTHANFVDDEGSGEDIFWDWEYTMSAMREVVILPDVVENPMSLIEL